MNTNKLVSSMMVGLKDKLEDVWPLIIITSPLF